MNIDRETFQNLGFASIIEKLSQLSYSKESSALLSTQQFLSSKFDLEEYLQVISDLKDIYDIESHPALYFPEISSIFKDLKPENSVVDGLKLYNIGQFYKNSAQFRDYLLQPREIFEQKEPSFLKHIPNEIPVDYSLILSTFNSEGEIFDSHPDVINLINDKSSLNSEISKLTNNILKDDEQFWQDKRAVYRNGRMLLPLKSNFKGRIKGVIHDVSSTGGTLFIEPFEMFNLNNRLVELENKKKIIKLKWIKYFSQQLHDELYALQSVYKMILELDTINARARYANLYNCTRASVSSNFNLKATIHPELGENAVPINIIFDKNCKMVIISGPNAGGKTVSLKTAALAVLMNQFGMFIHALDDSSLPLFKTVFTAIGDNQSIENGMSTFSASIIRISNIIKQSDKETLILLDELGSGTDPAEGTALGIAILDRFRDVGAYTLVTSHLKSIRNYGVTAKEAINASVEFDEKEHRPTYQLNCGLPGESHALDIAKRSGLPKELIENARLFLESNKTESMKLLENVTLKEQELNKREKNIIEDEKISLLKMNELKLKELSIKQKELEVKNLKKNEINSFVRKTRSELENLVAQLSNYKKEYSNDFSPSKEVKSFIAQMDKDAKIFANSIETLESEVITAKGFKFEVGMKVLVGKFRRSGEIIRKEKKNSWLISLGSLKMAVKESELVPDNGNKNRLNEKTTFQFYQDIDAEKPKLVLDVRGLTLNEAKEKLDKQIQLALVNNMSQFSLIHGLGTGVLSEGLRAQLSKIECVSEYNFARSENGGHGKTDIVLS